MASRTAHQSTVKALSRAKNGYKTLDEFAARFRFNVSKGTLSRALNGGSVSEWAENDIRAKLSMPPLQTVLVEACPDCGQAHTGRCYGKPIVQVVVLSENERIIRKGAARKRKRYHRPCMDDAEYAEYLAWKASRQ